MRWATLATTFLFLLVPHFAHAALTTSLANYWKLDEASGNLTDSSGSGSTLTNTGVATFGAGKINNAGILNGTSQYFQRADLSAFTAASNITVSAWINVTTAPASGAGGTIFDLQERATTPFADYQMMYENVAGTLTFRLNRGRMCVANGFSDVTKTFTTGTWYFVTMTYDGTNLIGYVNGSQVSSAAMSGVGINCTTPSDRTTIGTYQTGAAIFQDYFNGKIDEVGLWNRALSSSEVTQLYNSSAGLQYPFVMALINQLWAFWDF